MIISDIIAIVGITITMFESITYLLIGRFLIGLVIGITST